VARARKLLGPASDWSVDDIFFFEEEADEPALGHPDHLNNGSARRFSQLAIGVSLSRLTVGLRGMVPPPWRQPLFAAALAGSVLLLVIGRGSSSKLRFLAQAALALLLLTTAEPLLGVFARGAATPAEERELSHVFDVLWWFVPALLIVVAIERFAWTPAAEKSGNPVPTLLRWSVTTVIFMLALFGVIAFVYDYRLTGLLATSGVVAMIIGLAVQLNITNLVAGVALNLERSFRVGDWIMIHGRTPDPDHSVIGVVIDINWRTTRLRTADDTEIVIPNGIISEKTITNFMHPGEMSRFEIYFTVDQSVSPDEVIPVISKAVNRVIGTENRGPMADPPPKVQIRRATENGIEYMVRYRIMPSEVSPAKARHTINESVIRALRDAGIELAYPRRRILEESTPNLNA
jgi:branched-chain amino acid transport system substrate-binding protein